MNHRQFFDRVAHMRKIQKICSNTEDNEAALHSIEKEIDDEIERVQYILAHSESMDTGCTPDPRQCYYHGKNDCCRRQIRVEGRKTYIPDCRIAKYNEKQCRYFITPQEYEYMKKIRLHFPLKNHRL